jgi:hypothetical protein
MFRMCSVFSKTKFGVFGHRGSVILAEHGIGLKKHAHLAQSRSTEEIDLTKTLKKAPDSGDILKKCNLRLLSGTTKGRKFYRVGEALGTESGR